jgi:hypothetical protein
MAEPAIEKEKSKPWYLEFLDRTTLANVASFILVVYAGYKILTNGGMTDIRDVFNLALGYLIGRSGK